MAKSPTRRDITVDAVFDIETEDWTTFVAGGFLTKEGCYKVCDWRHEEEFARWILETEGTVWAHNGGRFDFLWLLDWFIRLRHELPCKCTCNLSPDDCVCEANAVVTAAGSSIISCRIGKLRLFDSYALVKISLADFAKQSGTEKQDTGLPCVCGEYCGGYCSIARGMPRPLFAKMLDYLRADCEALFVSLQRLREFALANDIDLGATVGGSAWRNMQRTLELPAADKDVNKHFFAREAYFGGRVQVLRPVSNAGWEFDVSAMYPSRLAFCPVPTGASTMLCGKDARQSYADAKPGIYKADVVIPQAHLCPLPVRTGDRVMYPYGEFTGTWCLPELQLAEELGATITPRQALVWDRSEILFAPWIERMFKLRAEAPNGGKKGPLGTFIKYLMNSPTGKFGMRPELERIIINPREYPKPCKCEHFCDGACGCYTDIDNAGWIVSQKTFRIEDCAHIEWSSYLTSEARCEWLRQALSLGDNGLSCVYGDTDSLFCERELTRNRGHDMLGKWDLNGTYTNFRAIAPKVYTFERGGKLEVKAKGIGLKRVKAKPADQTEEEKRYQIALNKKAKQYLEAGYMMSGSAIAGFRMGAKNGKFFEKASKGRHTNRGFGDRIYQPSLGYTVAQEYNQTEEECDD